MDKFTGTVSGRNSSNGRSKERCKKWAHKASWVFSSLLRWPTLLQSIQLYWLTRVRSSQCFNVSPNRQVYGTKCIKSGRCFDAQSFIRSAETKKICYNSVVTIPLNFVFKTFKFLPVKNHLWKNIKFTVALQPVRLISQSWWSFQTNG